MKAQRIRLARLRRLETVREVARKSAAAEAAQAESTLAQLEGLVSRTQAMAADYARRDGSSDGGTLLQTARFTGGLTRLTQTASADAQRARAVADAKLQLLAQAEQRTRAARERADEQAREIARGRESPALGSRRKAGTGLE